MMRFFVCSGIERAAGELFRAADTVPGVSPRCSAMVFKVTLSSVCGPDFFLGGGVIYRNLRASSKIEIWEMAPERENTSCQVRFARRPLSRDSSSTWALSDEYCTHQASTRFRLRIGMVLHLYGYNPSLATLSKRGGLPTLHSSRRKNIIILL